MNGRKLSSIWFLKLYLINGIKLKIEFICSVACIYSYSLPEILYVFLATKYFVNNLAEGYGFDVIFKKPIFALNAISSFFLSLLRHKCRERACEYLILRIFGNFSIFLLIRSSKLVFIYTNVHYT